MTYVREAVGEEVNIIWGTVTKEDFEKDKIVVTMIATGMDREKRQPKRVVKKGEKNPDIPDYGKILIPAPQELVIPQFLQDVSRRKKKETAIS